MTIAIDTMGGATMVGEGASNKSGKPGSIGSVVSSVVAVKNRN